MSELAPELRPIEVAPEKLILDPNNPRLISRDEDKRQESEAVDLLDQTIGRMRSKDYRVEEIENSIKQNGWIPVDYIFVKQLDEGKRYLVLEGNRRVTAIRNLRNDDEVDNSVKKNLEKIEVMEIIDDLPEVDLRKKITYLLGVRHHGSLKKWTPFAQAHNIYNRYLELSGTNEDTFSWDSNIAKKIADALSIELKDVSNRLKVYRAMQQIGAHSKIQSSENNGGGIRDRYYSVIAEIVLSTNQFLKGYIGQDGSTFLLDDESLDRIINLCHFEEPGRAGSPINKPAEWRSLAKILSDKDASKQAVMLTRVEVDKEKPSIVWAERSVELQKIQWDKWLRKVTAILSRVNLGDDLVSDEAKQVTQRLVKLIDTLNDRDK